MTSHNLKLRSKKAEKQNRTYDPLLLTRYANFPNRKDFFILPYENAPDCHLAMDISIHVEAPVFPSHYNLAIHHTQASRSEVH